MGRNPDYGQSKAGNVLLAHESAKHWGNDAGVVHVSFNPGNLKTELQRHVGAAQMILSPILFPAVYGAYTELYAGWSEELGVKDAGAFIIPWGRVGSVRPDITDGMRSGEVSEKFWGWCERECAKSM